MKLADGGMTKFQAIAETKIVEPIESLYRFVLQGNWMGGPIAIALHRDVIEQIDFGHHPWVADWQASLSLAINHPILKVAEPIGLFDMTRSRYHSAHERDVVHDRPGRRDALPGARAAARAGRRTSISTTPSARSTRTSRRRPMRRLQSRHDATQGAARRARPPGGRGRHPPAPRQRSREGRRLMSDASQDAAALGGGLLHGDPVELAARLPERAIVRASAAADRVPAAWAAALEAADGVWVPGEHARAALERSGVSAARMRVVVPSIDPERFHPEGPARRPADARCLRLRRRARLDARLRLGRARARLRRGVLRG